MPTILKKTVQSTAQEAAPVNAPAAEVGKVTLEPKMEVIQKHTSKNKVVDQEKKTDIKIPMVKVSEPYATVGFMANRKWSDGNYGSFDIGIWLTLPCESTSKDVNATFEAAKDFVDAKMTELLKGTPAEIKS